MAHVACIDGVDLVITKVLSRRPRVSCERRELPHDRWGDDESTGADGQTRRVDVSFDRRHLGPRLRVGDEVALVGWPVPDRGARCAADGTR